MKTRLLILATVICVSLIYTSCRKAGNTPTPATAQTTNTDALSGQIAMNLAKSLSGSYGGVNLNERPDSVSLALRSGYNPSALCGFFTDSLVDESFNIGDSIKAHTGGNLTFYFNCKDGKPSGYTAYDSLNTVQTMAKGVFTYRVKQSYTIECLDNKNQFNGVNGDIYFYNFVTCSCGHDSPIASANYILKNLKVDLCHQDVLSGTATFKAFGTGWNLSGTLTFLGNHKATMVIDGGKTYNVDLLTGALS